MTTFKFSILVIIGCLLGGCQEENCPNKNDQLSSSVIWTGSEIASPDFGEEIYQKLIELVSLNDTDFDTFIGTTGLQKTECTDMITNYSSKTELASLLSYKTPYWRTRMFSYRSNADKPYLALKKYLRTKKNYTYSQKNESTYFSEHFTDGYKEFSVQYSSGYCFYFVSYTITEEFNLLLNCWHSVPEEDSKDGILIFRSCLTDHQLNNKPGTMFTLKEGRVAEYFMLSTSDADQAQQGKWSYTGPLSKKLQIFDKDDTLVTEYVVIEIDKDIMKLKNIPK